MIHISLVMDTLTQKHGNFVAYVRETLAAMNVAIDLEVEDFLKKKPEEMISQLKLLLSCMPIEAIEKIIINKLHINENQVPPDRMDKLRCYSTYFLTIAKSL